MIDDIFNSPLTAPALVNGKIYLTDKEIEFIMSSYALYGAGYNQKRGMTVGFHKTHRKAVGMDLWENMTDLDRKKEFFSHLRRDLTNAVKHLEDGNRIDYLLSRAIDPMDPMKNFYKVFLVKMGASITEEGSLKISRELKERLDNWDLKNKPIIDFVPLKELELNKKLEIEDLSRTLKIKRILPY